MTDLISNEKKYIVQTYKRFEIIIEKGKECYLITRDGKQILDMFSGLAVNLLGYNNKKVNDAILNQLNNYIHISNYFFQEPQIKLAALLSEISGYSKVFFCNSGTEAAEASIKAIRKKFYNSNKKKIISFTGAFHGRTMGSLSLTRRPSYRNKFEPLLSDTVELKFNDVRDLENNINENTAAVFIEVIQGEGGIVPASEKFTEKLKDLHARYDFILVADEIQSGLGRTGKFFGFNWYGLVPDIVLMAKGLGGGLPLGAMLVNEKCSNIFEPGDHGTTFGGNPVSCAAGIVILNELVNGLIENVISVGNYLIHNLNKLKLKYPNQIKEVRGKGFMVGIEMNYQCDELVKDMLNRYVLINCTNNNVIRLLPPLIIKKEQIDFFIEKFNEILKEKNPA